MKELQKKSTDINLFFHCDSSDNRFLNDNELLGYLKGLKYQGIIVKSELDILPGDEKDKARIELIRKANIIVLIISQRWLDSDFVVKQLFPIIEKNFKKSKLEIIPVLADNCEIDASSWFSNLQFFPHPGISIYIDFQDEGQKLKLYKSIRNEITKRTNNIRRYKLNPVIPDNESILVESRDLIKIGQNKLARFYLENSLKSKVGEANIEICNLLIETGNCQRKTGAQTAAYQNYLTAYNIAKKISNEGLESLTLNCIGNIYKEQGKLTEAVNFYKKSLNLVDEQNLIVKSNLNVNLGSTYRRIGDFDLSLKLISQSSSDLRKLAKKEINIILKNKIYRHLAIALGMLSLCNISSNDNKSALINAEEGLKLSLEFDNFRGVGFAKHRVAQVYLALSMPLKALPLLKEAYFSAQEAEDFREVFAVLLDIGNCYMQMGYSEDAERYFFSAMMNGVITSDFFRIAQSHEWIANLRVKNNQSSFYYFEVAKRLFKLVDGIWWYERVESSINKLQIKENDEDVLNQKIRACNYIEDILSENSITKNHFDSETIAKTITP